MMKGYNDIEFSKVMLHGIISFFLNVPTVPDMLFLFSTTRMIRPWMLLRLVKKEAVSREIDRNNLIEYYFETS